MRKFLILFIIFLVLGLTYFYFRKNSKSPAKKIPSPTKSNDSNNPPSPAFGGIRRAKEKKSIFVPDWSLTGEKILANGYDRWIYFGDVAKIDEFISCVPQKNNLWFTLKITKIPEQTDWEALAKETLDEAKNKAMSGLVLDLEISELPTDKTVSQINQFVEFFYTKIKEANIKLALAIYGDVFYRRRPYDLLFLEKHCDEIMIMAYDFHKSGGEPGPNFPFSGINKYGYDFQTMIDDFLKFVPSEKLTVIFGMYGYDWTVDEKKRPIKPAVALTLNQINEKFLKKCEWQDCLVRRDNLSAQTEVDYVISRVVDNYGYLDYHIVWFEDMQSVNIKWEFLKKKGIGSITFWAYGYF